MKRGVAAAALAALMTGRVETKGALFQRALHLQLNVPAGPCLRPKWRKIVGIFLCFTCTKGIGMLAQGAVIFALTIFPLFSASQARKGPFSAEKTSVWHCGQLFSANLPLIRTLQDIKINLVIVRKTKTRPAASTKTKRFSSCQDKKCPSLSMCHVGQHCPVQITTNKTCFMHARLMHDSIKPWHMQTFLP